MKRNRDQIDSLSLKLIISVGIVLFASLLIWSIFSIRLQEKALLEKAVSDTDKFCNTVLNFTWFAMMHNPNKDMQKVLTSMSDYNEIETIRLFDSQGLIKFSSQQDETGTRFNKKNVACRSCHVSSTPVMKKERDDRVRIFKTGDGRLWLGLINPILNKPSCSTAQCHYHSPDVKKLGSLDVVVSLSEIQAAIFSAKKRSVFTCIFLFVVLSITICFFVFRLVSTPIKHLINQTERIGKGTYTTRYHVMNQKDEIGRLSAAILDMGNKISAKQEELNTQKEMYQNLFDQVPCTITVQNKDFRLIEFNKEFAKRFNPAYGEYCYAAYKNQEERCINCPVAQTFLDGKSHFSEESGTHRDGSTAHWFVKTAPLKDKQGNIVAAMEMSIDISQRKQLEATARDSEQRYQAIFKSIPNPVFILETEKHTILDCNDSALFVYGYEKDALSGQPFSILFADPRSADEFLENPLQVCHERLTHIKENQEHMYVNIWLQPATLAGQQVLLATVIDITVSVETQQQLIQAGKMATLGEMATGVAHELNQPLSVIKTASGFILKKLENNESIQPEILKTLSSEIESHVDRAAKITSHMRLFGRKSAFNNEDVNINETLRRAFDIFSQQLKLREIEVVWELDEQLPAIRGDQVKLEQVFINLLINARDAIVARFEESETSASENERCIKINTAAENQNIIVRISDTGTGIKDKDINKIFEPFFTTKNPGEGTGLGLSISYGILRESGADIRVENNATSGVTFTIIFNTAREASDGTSA